MEHSLRVVADGLLHLRGLGHRSPVTLRWRYHFLNPVKIFPRVSSAALQRCGSRYIHDTFLHLSTMATKTVALDGEAYRVLAQRKRPSETFSDVVKRVARPRRPLTDFIGIWRDVPEKEFERFQEARRVMRAADLTRTRRLVRR